MLGPSQSEEVRHGWRDRAPEINEAKETYWQRMLQVRKDSGLKACEFQRQNNLSKHAFVYWKLKLIGAI